MVTPGSGLIAFAVMVDGVPACTMVGFAEQVTCGGLCGTLTLKLAPQLVTLWAFGPFGSVRVAFAV